MVYSGWGDYSDELYNQYLIFRNIEPKKIVNNFGKEYANKFHDNFKSNCLTNPQRKELISSCKQWMVNYKLEPIHVAGHCELDRHGKTCPNMDIQKFRQSLF